MNKDSSESFKALAKAEEAIEATEYDINGGFTLAAANRAYYSFYYCMVALLLVKNVYAKTHHGTRAKFSELFIKTNIFSDAIATYIKNAFELRQEADYDLDAEISLDIAKELLNNAKEFHKLASNYLQETK